MQERKITLIDIGVGALPSVTPVTAQNSSWFPTVYVSPETPPVDGVTPEPVADGVLIEWDAVDQAGVVYIIERGPSQNGPWTEIHRTTETRYLYSDGSGQKWFFRITASVRGKPGQGTVVEATPAPTTAELIAAQQKLDKEIVDRALADANEAASRVRDIALVNAGLVQEAQTRVTQIGQTMDAVAAESQTRATQLLNEKMERQAAITAVSETQQNGFDSLSRALSEVAAGSGTQFDSKTIWHFTTTVEGWGSNGGAPTLNDGWLRPTNNSASYAQSPAALGIDGNAYRFIKLRMRRTGNPVWLGLVRWTTEADQAWNDGKSTTIAPPAFDAAGVATVDISDIPWSGPSPIRQVRIALTRGQTVNDYVEYDYIAIGRPAPGASVALVQEERQARVTALAAEASERNTLAVQMRGNYTGSDLSQAQGFVGDERTARVAADSSQVQRITTMEARMPAGSGGLATIASVTSLQDAMVAADAANAQSINAINASLPALMTQGSNLILNGSWESGDDVGWTYGGANQSIVSEGRSGRCWKTVGAPTSRTARAMGDSPMPVLLGKKYRVSAYYRTDPEYNGSSGNGKVRVANQDNGLIASLAFVAGRAEWTRVETVVNVTSISGIRIAITADNTAGTLWVDDVALEEVTDVLANADGLSALTTRVTSVEGTQSAQATLINQVQTGLGTTNGNVTAAQQAAQAAADLAGSKGKVIYQNATPSVADRQPQNLWIDTTGNSNTPKRWNGSAWASATDKVATDAAAAASAAQQTANAAQQQASATAGALSTLDTKVTQQGNTINAQGQAITAVNLRADGLQAGLNSIGGDNLLGNSGFEQNGAGWIANSISPGAATIARTFVDSTLAGSTKAARWDIANLIPGSSYEYVSGSSIQTMKVEPRKQHTISVYVRGNYSARVFLQFRWHDSTGAVITYSGTPASADRVTEADWARHQWTAVAPANAATCNLYIRVYGANAPDQWVEWDNAQVQVGSIATGYVPSAMEAAATLAGNVAVANTLTGKVTTLEGTTTVQGQAITTVSAGLAQANRSGSNMVVDGSFEGRASGTALAAWAVVGPGGRTGTNALAVSGDGVARSTVIQTFDVTPGRTYYAEAWVKRVGSATGGTIQLRGNLSLNGASATYPYFQQLNVSQLNTEDWVKISGKLTIPEGKNQLHFQEYHTGNLVSGQQILWDDFVLLDVTEAAAAQGVADAAATGLSALTTTVTQQGGQITALGQQVNQVGASVAGKADTQVVQTLTAMVKDTMSGGGNLLSNTLFKDGSRGWGWWNSDNGVWNGLGLVAGPEWAPPGLAHFGGFAPSNLALNSQFWAGDEQPVPVVAGKRYCFSAYINCHRVGLALLISFRDANGNTVGEQYSGPADATNVRPPITLERLKRLSASMVAPASAVYARVGYYLRGLGLSNNEGNYFWIFQPMLEEMREGQTGPSPYSAGGGETLAGYSLYVTADGLTGGMVTKNDGKVVDMKILANVLQILSPNQPEGIEMRDGYIRVWKGNSQRIIGTGFGGGDLMDYFGPNVGAGAANKLNATMWMDVNGNAYWGGSLSAGIWKNANRTSSTAANPYVEVGPFAAHGKQRVVVASFSTFSPTYTTWYDGRSSSNEPPPPAIASNTVLRLRRNVGAGLELVSQQAFPASAVLVNLTYHDRDAGIRELPNGGWQQEYYFACSGSFTATEPGSTFQNFIYEGAITTQAIPQIVSQTIAVVSTEEP